MTLKISKRALQLVAALALTSASLASQAATLVGCQAKGALYVLENGKQTLQPITVGAGTTAAASNQGHAGFKTDANGEFTISYPTTPLTPTQQYYFRMEVHNSQYLAYGIPGKFGNTFKTMANPVKGQIVCDGTSPSQVAGVNLGALITAKIEECSAVKVGEMCGLWFKFAPTYHAPIGYEAALPTSYPTVPKCSSSTATSYAPSTSVSGPSSGCFRRFWVKRVAAPNPAGQWGNIIDVNSWQLNATPQNLVVGEQIAN